jgi:hypothetical protein
MALIYLGHDSMRHRTGDADAYGASHGWNSYGSRASPVSEHCHQVHIFILL